MLKIFAKFLMFFGTIFLIGTVARAQVTIDSLTQTTKPVYAGIVNNFYKKVGIQARVYNGIAYDFYDPAIQGNAYFKDVNHWKTGTVIYDGYNYSNVSLMYDIYADEVIMLYNNHFLKISLLSNQVSSFDLLGNHFIYIKNDPANNLTTGFYNELYHGKMQVLAHYSKSIQTNNDISGNIISYFNPGKDYYLFKDGKYYKVNSQGTFLNLLKDHKKQIREFIRANNIKYKNSPEEAMASIAAHYDNLSN